MKKLHFIYEMCINFSIAVINHVFSLRCIPKSDALQRIYSIEKIIDPVESMTQVMDGFGNLECNGRVDAPHDYFSCRVEGIAFVNAGNRPQEVLQAMYRYPSILTRPGRQINEFLNKHEPPYADSLRNAEYLMNELYGYFSYVPGVTTIHTTAEEALERGQGVCQDYAHILISLCRKAGIPARYTMGFMIGEGATHAWIEVYSDGRWYGLDPTNNLWIDDNYIRVAIGRDYADCPAEKGYFTGLAAQNMSIYVKVEEAEGK